MRPSLICAGLATIERIVLVERMPLRGSKGRARGYSERVGGVGAIAAMAACGLGADVRLFAPVGDDAAGREIVMHLRSRGVDVAGVRSVAGAQSTSEAILVDADGRQANARYEDDRLQVAATLPDMAVPSGAQAVLADLAWTKGAAHMLSAAKQHGIPSVAVVGAGDRAEPDCCIADHVLIGAVLSPETGESDDAEMALQRFSKRGCGETCVAVDAGRVLLVIDGQDEQALVPGLEPSDATGVFAGAYAMAIAHGMPVVAAARFAGVAAKLARITIDGAYKFPSREDVDAAVVSL